MTLERALCWVHVCIERIAQQHPWVPFRWQLSQVQVVPEGTPAPACTENAEWALARVGLYTDEAEGYYLNCTAPQPAWFVHYRVDTDDDTDARPEVRLVTLSYHEAGRLLDASETVENLPTDDFTARWLAEFAQTHFVPEVKKRRRAASFRGANQRDQGPSEGELA